MGKVLILIGLLFLAAGILLSYFPHIFRWLGKLPGDFSWKSGSFSFHFPLATSLVISLILSLIFWLFRK
jgi:hypothetical protein